MDFSLNGFIIEDIQRRLSALKVRSNRTKCNRLTIIAATRYVQREEGRIPPSYFLICRKARLYNLSALENVQALCCKPTITKYHAPGFSGEFSSIVIGSDNLPLISYYDEGDNRAIKVMHCLNTACTSAIISTVDIVPSDVSRPNSTSITISDDGLGLVAYAIQQGVDKTPTLKVAHCENLDCSNVTVSELDSFPGGTNSNPVIATGSDGLGLIAYTDSQGGPL